MTTLLVMTTGQSDVQLVKDGQRHKLDGNTCGTLHDAIAERAWTVVDVPLTPSRDFVKELPEGETTLCTPKLDAVLTHINSTQPISVLLFETSRQHARDPRMSGQVMERRLRDRGIQQVAIVQFLTGTEQLEDPSNNLDSVVRRSVVAKLSTTIGEHLKALTKNDRVFVATTGGLAAANDLINELVRLHAVGGPTVTALEVPDGNRAQQEERAIEENFHPAAGYRARWHALSLIEKGNLLGARGAVSHLEGVPGQEWTQVVKWLAHFAASLPLPPECDIGVLSHKHMAVRAALRVELALRARDIPRAIHGTVSFFESALWDKLSEHFDRDAKNDRFLVLRTGEIPPTGNLLRDGGEENNDNTNRPFESKSRSDGRQWFWFHESGAGRFARDYVKSEPLKKLNDAIEKVKPLRNDVAHNEPTPARMNKARCTMRSASLWSSTDTFLSQPLVQAVLKEFGEVSPQNLLEDLLTRVRSRLVSSM